MFPIHTYAELEIFHLHTYTVQCKDATYSIVPRLIAHRQPGSRAACTHCWSVHYDLPSLSSNWHQALIPSNTSRSIKIPPGIRRHLLQLWPVIMDKSNILWFLEIYTHVYQLHPVLTWVICTHLNGEHLLEHLACHACREKPVCISVINCFCILLKLRSTMHEAAGMVNLSLCISKT